jgi:hypothetical protein
VRSRKVNVLSDPELIEMLGDDPELLAIADAIAETQHEQKRRPRRKALLLAAAIAALLLLAVPAIAAFTPLIDFKDAPRAPAAVVERFSDLERQAPPAMDPRAIASEARRLDLTNDGKPVALFLAPTETGGYCFEIAGNAAGCNADRSLSVSVGFAAPTGTTAPALVYGSVLDPLAVDAVLTAADGTEKTTRVTRVTAPIEAGFFAAWVDEPVTDLPIDVQIRDGDGHTIATGAIPSPPTG